MPRRALVLFVASDANLIYRRPGGVEFVTSRLESATYTGMMLSRKWVLSADPIRIEHSVTPRCPDYQFGTVTVLNRKFFLLFL